MFWNLMMGFELFAALIMLPTAICGLLSVLFDK